MKANFSLISIVTRISGFLTSTLRCGNLLKIAPPTSADISGDFNGNFLSERLPSTLKVLASLNCSARYSGAVSKITAISFSTCNALE